MKKDEDDLPTVEQSSNGLGVRMAVDIDVDGQGNVMMNGKGMSVAPSWRKLPIYRIPRRLRDKIPKARGSNSVYCFKYGAGPFVQGAFAAGLELVPDSSTHGCVVPAQTTLLAQFERDLADTRGGWQIDES